MALRFFGALVCERVPQHHCRVPIRACRNNTDRAHEAVLTNDQGSASRYPAIRLHSAFLLYSAASRAMFRTPAQPHPALSHPTADHPRRSPRRYPTQIANSESPSRTSSFVTQSVLTLLSWQALWDRTASNQPARPTGGCPKLMAAFRQPRADRVVKFSGKRSAPPDSGSVGLYHTDDIIKHSGPTPLPQAAAPAVVFEEVTKG